MRDPRKEPKENDKLFCVKSDKYLIIDFVKKDYIYYRVCRGESLLFRKKCKPERFKELALKQCKPARGGQNENTTTRGQPG